jgi:Plant transposon protein
VFQNIRLELSAWEKKLGKTCVAIGLQPDVLLSALEKLFCVRNWQTKKPMQGSTQSDHDVSSSSTSDDDEDFEMLVKACCDAANNSLEMCHAVIVDEIDEEQEEHRPRKKRTNKNRNIAFGGERLFRDYFSDNPVYCDVDFKRRFRMSRRLCSQIISDLCRFDDFFLTKIDAAGRVGATPHQKVTAALRCLAYGVTADAFDAELRMSRVLIQICTKRFCAAIKSVYGETFLRSPTRADLQFLMEENRKRGLPGMWASYDCSHLLWEMCPVAHHGQHLNKDGTISNVLEAIASKDTWIWHSFFGMAGSCNDINVLDASPFVTQLMSGGVGSVEYLVNGNMHCIPYVLADGIYPNWRCFMKGISKPINEKEKHFTAKVSALRKDVERAFGILKKRWAILKNPSRMMFIEDITATVQCCIILHNMIIEDEREMDDILDRMYFLDEVEAQDFVRSMKDDVIILHNAAEAPQTQMQLMLDNYIVSTNEADFHALRSDLIEEVFKSK